CDASCMDQLAFHFKCTNRRRRRARWKRINIDEHSAILDAQRIRRQLFRKRRRRTTVFGAILISVPGACDAAVNDASLAKWSRLVCANIADGRELIAEAEDRDDLVAGGRNYFAATIYKLIDVADVEPIYRRRR